MFEKPIKTQQLGLSGIAILPERMRQLRPELIDQLAQSFLDQGQLQPISVRPRSENGIGYILIAGRHRLEAARKLRWEAISAQIHYGLDADRALLMEIEENLVRGELSPIEEAQHLNEQKRLYEKLHPAAKHGGAPGKAGGGKKAKDAKLASFVDDAAKQTGRSRRTVARSITRANQIPKQVLGKAVGTALDQGDELDALAKLPVEQQRALAERAAAGEKVSAKIAAKQQHRNERERELGARTIAANAALGRMPLFDIVYMDPASRFQVYSRETGLDRAADNHYLTEIWEEIIKKPPPLTENGILGCWTTRAQLVKTARVIEDHWGLTYRTCQIWGKEGRGTGYILIDNAEILLIAARGEPVWPAFGTQDMAYRKTLGDGADAVEIVDWKAPPWAPGDWEAMFPPVIETIRKRGRHDHSVKPDIFAEQFERLWPNTPKFEMYARRRRPGWDVHGNEVPEPCASTQNLEPAPPPDRPKLTRPGAAP